MESLARKPQAVGELAATLPISRPAVSQHLKLLKGSGLVTDEAIGTRRVYRVVPDAVRAIREYLDLMWDRALSAYAAVFDEPGEDETKGDDNGRTR